MVPSGNVHKGLFRDISRSPEKDSIDGLVAAFASATLPMLNNVSLATALEVRKSGRLAAFRQYLQDVWAATATIDAEPKSPGRERELTDRLRTEHQYAAEEWASIYKDLGVRAATSMFAVPLAEVIDARLMLAVGPAVLRAYQRWSSATRAFKRNPAALLVDLENESNPNPLRRIAARLERHT